MQSALTSGAVARGAGDGLVRGRQLHRFLRLIGELFREVHGTLIQRRFPRCRSQALLRYRLRGIGLLALRRGDRLEREKDADDKDERDAATDVHVTDLHYLLLSRVLTF